MIILSTVVLQFCALEAGRSLDQPHPPIRTTSFSCCSAGRTRLWTLGWTGFTARASGTTQRKLDAASRQGAMAERLAADPSRRLRGNL